MSLAVVLSARFSQNLRRTAALSATTVTPAVATVALAEEAAEWMKLREGRNRR
jgi:hypothetical protein